MTRFLLALLVAGAALAAQPATPPAPTQWVTDNAGFMSAPAAQALNARLRAYEMQTGHQLLVWIGTTTGGVPIEDFAVRAFEAWRVGRQGIDDGLVLFIMPEDRQLRIEVGYGLEGEIPDALASRIINEVIVPAIQMGDTDGAVTAGMEAVASSIDGPGLTGGTTAVRPTQQQRERQPLTLIQLIFYGIVAIAFLALLATNPGLAIYLLASVLSGGNRQGRGGGFGGGGGGWSGGGGRSGGGGASGRW